MDKAVPQKERKAMPLHIIAITVVVTLVVSAIFQWMRSVTGAKPQQTMEAYTAFREQAGNAPNARKIAYWRAPMNPAEIYDKPGKSTMGMDLIPVYEDELAGAVDISIDPVIQQNMGLRTAAVTQKPLAHTIRTYGHVTYDETRTVQVSPKVSGWIETIHVNFTGKSVAVGEPLFEIYAPELVAVQEEYLSAFRSSRRLARDGQTDLLASARRRLQYFDIAQSEIQTLESTGNVRKTLLIRSPFGGVVIQKNAEEGSHIKAGTMVYRIADLSRVWVEAHIYDHQLPWVKAGQEVEMTLPYLPGKIFTGKVAYVYPYLQPKTRDVVVRLEFDNADLLLKPDMYADVRIRANAESEGMVIPSEAVIRSGERNVVFVARGEGKFSPREVSLGLSLDGGQIQILTGISRGDLVVTSGQFLLDSESKLKEAMQKMVQIKMAPARPAPKGMENEKGTGLREDVETEPRLTQ